MIDSPAEFKPCEGKLGVLLPGLGAVSTTFIAGISAIRRGLALPIGSLTQMGNIRIGLRTEVRYPKIKDFVPLARLDDLAFGAWDIFEDDCHESALNAGVLEKDLLEQVKDDLVNVKPMKGVFSREYVKKLDGPWVKEGQTKMDLARQLMDDIQRFKEDNGCERLVMIWCASTEVFLEQSEVHMSIERFERGLRENDPAIAPSMIYAYAALQSGVPFANGAPNLTVDIPAMRALAL